MCGRAVLSSTRELVEELELLSAPEMPPRFNIAPTQPIAVIREPHRLELLRWGLIIPPELRRGSNGINARVETVARAPAYRDSFRKRRCLVIVDGFYEWQKRDKARQPFLIRRDDRKPFALAGIWDHSVTTDGEIVDACAILTGEPKGVMVALHDRMPLIVPASAFARWLDPSQKELADLLVPGADGLVSIPVSSLVNSPANDDPRCIDPIDPADEVRGTLPLF